MDADRLIHRQSPEICAFRLLGGYSFQFVRFALQPSTNLKGCDLYFLSEIRGNSRNWRQLRLFVSSCLHGLPLASISADKRLDLSRQFSFFPVLKSLPKSSPDDFATNDFVFAF